MEYIFNGGFLGTKAPLFMDITIVILILIPLLIGGSVWLARKEYYDIHHKIQLVSFILSLLTLIYFIYNIYSMGDIDLYIKDTIIEAKAIIYVYITIFLITNIFWYRTLKFALEDNLRRALPGLYSSSHKRWGKVTAIFVGANSIIYMVVYLILFII